MSEIAIIAREYYELVTLFRKINHSTLLLKEHHVQLQVSERIKKQDLVEARNLLARVLHYIIVEIDDDSIPNEWEEELLQVSIAFANNSRQHHIGDEADRGDEEHSASVSVVERLSSRTRGSKRTSAREEHLLQIPPLFIIHLQQQHRGALPAYVEGLRELQKALVESEKLTDRLIAQLDELCDQLDSEITSTYRKLHRR